MLTLNMSGEEKMMMGFEEVECDLEVEIDDSFTHEKDLVLKNRFKPQGKGKGKEKLSHRTQDEGMRRGLNVVDKCFR